MRIALCWPPHRDYSSQGRPDPGAYWPPLGIAYIKSHLGNNGYEDVKIFDFYHQTMDLAVQELVAYKPDVVGITTLTEERMSVFELARRVKEQVATKVILGGPHISIMGERLLEDYPYIDHLVYGEGEEVFLYLLNRYGTDIPKGALGKIPTRDILSSPFAYPDIANVEAYSEIPMITSRGCTGACTFCSTTNFWKGWRRRGTEDLLKEIDHWQTKTQVSRFKFLDDSFSIDRDSTIAFCEGIMDKHIEYEIVTRADKVDKELLELLARSGCHNICYGIESGSKKILQSIRKEVNLEQAAEALIRTREAGIVSTALMMIGNFGESNQTIHDTIEFLRIAEPTRVSTSLLMVFPGTKIYDKCKAMGWIDDEYWLKDAPTPFYNREQDMNTLWGWNFRVHNFRR